MNSSSSKRDRIHRAILKLLEEIDEDAHAEYEAVIRIIDQRVDEGFCGIKADQLALMYDIVEKIGVKYATIEASMVSYAYTKGNKPEDEIPDLILLYTLTDYLAVTSGALDEAIDTPEIPVH